MKKELILIFAVFFLISLPAITGVYAFEENSKIITISKKEADITGDGINDRIYLKALPSDGKHSFLKKIFMEVQSSNKKEFKIPVESGIEPSFQLVDLDHDGVKDLFVSVPTGGSGGISNNYAYTLKDFVVTNLDVPNPIEIESHFINGYKAQIKVIPTNQAYIFHLNDRKSYYEKLGLYYKGKLNEPTELTVNPFSTLEPVLYKGDEMGIKGIQRITGVANADTIATVESLWYFVDGNWKLVNVNVFTNTKEK
ncbi:MAG: hypothetical protein Q8934_08240 [Bacillota bacterium]|nr:hypothetical protein [Bacillota bacterium]